ncbi:MAG: DEAD/DEAH box helicase [Lutispora sp.]
MRFNPILAAHQINETYRDYMKSTFYIRDEELREAYFKELDDLNFAKGPYLECVDAFETGQSIQDLVEKGVLSSRFKKLLIDDSKQYERSMYLHQEHALKEALDNKNMIVTTGTGSGKTECFLYPVLDYLLKEEEAGSLCPGVRILLLYPMNALANDQMQRLRKTLKDYPSITFGAYTGETENVREKALGLYHTLHNGEDPLENELICRDKMKLNPPHILVTNYAMLEYLLLRPMDNVFFDDFRCSNHWKYIVLDEAHVYAGASGMEVSILIRRLIHRLPNNEKIRFILTSATLGDTSKDQDILKFATSLCANREFEAKSIIRAIRRTTNAKVLFIGNEKFYKAVDDVIATESYELSLNSQTIKERLLTIISSEIGNTVSFNPHDSANEILYSIFSSDSLYKDIREGLFHGAITLEELSKQIGLSEETLLHFINIASFAQKNGGKLLDARYHHFIRTLEGAYVSFSPKKTLSLIPKKTIKVNNEEYKVFKLSVCQFCGEIYIEGNIRNKVFEQDTSGPSQHYMVVEKSFLAFNEDDDDIKNIKKHVNKKNQVYKLCSKCGVVSSYSSPSKCSCPSDASILIYEVLSTTEDHLIHKCGFCKTVNPKGSILRGFYLGQDASTAVVAESLYKQIPESFIEIPERKKEELNQFVTQEGQVLPEKTRRLLLFSDSRQDAAYFASYFQYTYDVFFRRRIMLKAARELIGGYPDKYKDGIPLNSLANRMISIFERLDKEGLGPDIIEKEVWKTIANEFKDLSRNSLHSIGWIDYQLKEEVLIKNDLTFESLTIPLVQANMIAHHILEYCIRHGAIQFPSAVSMTQEDWSYFDFSSKEPVICQLDSGQKKESVNARFIVPKTQNSLTEYLKRVFPGSQVDYESILKTFFSSYFINDKFKILIPSKGKQYQYKINPEKIVVKIQDYNGNPKYICSVCGRITSINIGNNCPHYRCDGTLSEFDFYSSDTKNYYINQYGVNTPLIPITIKEHTAQLSKETAQDYQHKFIRGNINILSCSTTFEMGVDVGNLETVFMKNVPPKPSNYIQRAGRAGRRLTSAAFALTFCKLSPHDFYFYQHPTDMINGTISPPSFKIDNPKIVRRHVFAVLLSSYWKELFSDYNNISDFFINDSYVKIEQYVQNLPSDVYRYIKKIVPNSLESEIENFITQYTKELLPHARNMYLSDIDEYGKAIVLATEEKKYKVLPWLDKMSNTYKNEPIINFYSRNNLIPKYGFPVDTVDLRTDLSSKDFHKDAMGLSLQRDLIQAISDYAPDSEVVADGNMYTSRYIRKPLKKESDWKVYLVEICGNPACGKITYTPFLGDSPKGKKQCSQCGEQEVSGTVMLIPESGFYIEPRVEKATTKRPKKTSRTEFYYIGEIKPDKHLDAKVHKLKDITFSLISSPNDKLLVMNKSEFNVCNFCGYAIKSTGAPLITLSHKNTQGNECKSKSLIKRSLGHIFNTDVLLLNIDQYLPKEKAITLLYTFLEGCSVKFEIDRDDIDGCISYQNYSSEGASSGTTFVLFDSVPGGAGNVKRLYDSSKNEFIEFLQTSLSRVNNCTCGTDGDTVCYSCLCNFKNQYYQEMMQRRYAIEFLDNVLFV